jgi:hypothetical protein
LATKSGAGASNLPVGLLKIRCLLPRNLERRRKNFAKDQAVSLCFAMKWFFVAAATILVAVFFFWQRDSVKTSYVNGLPEYSSLPNKEYLFQSDCYIFKFKKHDTAWPLVGTHAVVPELPVEVDEKNIGLELPGVRILGVVRFGSRLKLVSVRRDQSRQGTAITFEILFMDEAERKYPRLDVFYLLDHGPEKDGAPPKFIESYVVPRVQK